MTSNEVLRSLASEIQLFNDIEQKQTFLFVLGALFSRFISLKKAAKICHVTILFWMIEQLARKQLDWD